MNRDELLSQLAQAIVVIPVQHPIRVAIDGIDAAGKTQLADELVAPVERLGYQVIRASIDHFHLPRDVRYQRGSLSPEGYYCDSYDYDALKTLLLVPLGEGGSCKYRTAIFDFRDERAVDTGWQQANEHSVLLFDGIFLQRPEINDHWDVRIWVDIPFTLALERAYSRDIALFRSKEVIDERYTRRYIPGQQLYIDRCQPKDHAQWIVENSDPLHPMLYRNTS